MNKESTMNIELKIINQITRELLVTIDHDTYTKDYQKALDKFNKKVRIDGFRIGKAPKLTLERLYKEDINNYYLENFAGSYYHNAIQKISSKPIGQGSFQDALFLEDGKVEFIYQFECLPEEFEYSYDNLEISFQPEVYTEELLQEKITQILKDNAEEVPFEKDQTLNIGNKVKLMNLNTNEELPFLMIDSSGLKFSEHEHIDLDLVKGLKLDDKFTYLDIEYLVLDAFQISVPELNDETANILGYENVSLLRESIKENLKNEIEKRNNTNINYLVAEAFGIKNKENIQIPKTYLVNVGKHAIKQLMYGNVTDEQIEKFPEATILDFAEKQLPNIIWNIAYEKIAKDNNIVVNENEIETEIAKYAGYYKISIEEFKTKFQHNIKNIEEDLLNTKVLSFIQQFCKIIETKKDIQDLNT